MRNPEEINYLGFNIIYLDYSNLRIKEEILQFIDDGSNLIRSKPLNSVLSLVNMENLFFNNEIRSYLAEKVKGNSPYVKKSAVYGLNGLISVMYNGFVLLTGRNVKSFTSREEAINYLVS